MLKPTAAAALILLALLPGCGQAPSAGNTASTDTRAHITIRNEWQEKLLKLNANDRNLTLRRAIRDDDGQCPHISDSKFKQDYKSMKMWVAHCSSGDWAVFLAPSGDVQVRACKDIPQLNADNKALNLPICHPWPTDPLALPPEPSLPEPAPPAEPVGNL